MTDHDFSDLTPPDDLITQWCQEHAGLRDVTTAAARWGAEQAAERLQGQWPTPITDRRPTKKDGDTNGWIQYLDRDGFWRRCRWESVAQGGDPWAHPPGWQPPTPPTLKEQALATVKYGLAGETLSFEALELIRRALEQSDG